MQLATAKPWPETAILGGSFNPVHNGHVRLAVEVLEHFNPVRLDVLPCGNPPHKQDRSMLPFALRLELARMAFADMGRIRVSSLEGKRQGPSYTVDTLEHYIDEEPDLTPLFIMGVTDFLILDEWHRGWQVPELADLVLVDRMGNGLETVRQRIESFWGDNAAPSKGFANLKAGQGFLRDERGIPYCSLAPAHGKRGGPDRECRIYYLPMARMDISASMLRDKWLDGKSLRGLTPRSVERELAGRARDVRKAWSSETTQGHHP